MPDDLVIWFRTGSHDPIINNKVSNIITSLHVTSTTIFLIHNSKQNEESEHKMLIESVTNCYNSQYPVR